ncbi:hypothetical protein DHD80_15715 [Gramella sp. AN32]|nr:hypothetical protein [Gramella sp. AN32]
MRRILDEKLSTTFFNFVVISGIYWIVTNNNTNKQKRLWYKTLNYTGFSESFLFRFKDEINFS